MWTEAERVLAATAALGTPGPPRDLPDNAMLLPAGPLLAARQNPDRTAQMVLRREHDALVLSIGWRSEADAPASGWDGHRRQWAQIFGADRADLLGAAEILVGTGPSADPARLLADGADEPWTTDGAEVSGVTVWELPPYDDHARAQRSLLALAPEAEHARLSALVWSDGSPAMPVLAEYLLHAAKVRYELRVRLSAGADLRAAIAGEREADLKVAATRLDDLRHTIGIARSNMAASLSASGGIFADDRATADWLDDLITDDLHYIGNARARAGAGGAAMAPTGPVVALVAALPVEYEAMAAFVDDAREVPIDGDSALYTVGTIPSADPERPHPVVLTMLGGTANNDAAAAVAHLVRSFETVSQVLMVGIAAGVPMPSRPAVHVRLGDIVVSTWGIVDYDHVNDKPDGVSLRQAFPRPSYLLGVRAKALEAGELRQVRPWEDELDRLIGAHPQFARPDSDSDALYASDNKRAQPLAHPAMDASGHRPDRPRVHYGRIGSANRSLRNTRVRDELAARYDVRAIEMEGSGIGMSAFAAGRDWLVIRGVSDYGDSRLGALWRPYASAAAAAYARALLGRCPPVRPH